MMMICLDIVLAKYKFTPWQFAALLGIVFFANSPLYSQGTAAKKYEQKRFIERIEFAIGPTLSGIRGFAPSSPSLQNVPNYTNYATYFVSSLGGIKGYLISAGLSQKMGDHFSISGRIVFDQKGYTEQMDSIVVNMLGALESKNFLWKRSIKNEYINASILPQFIVGKKSKFNVGIGGYVGILLNTSFLYNQNNGYTYFKSTSASNAPIYNKYDYGLALNIGYSYPLENYELTLQLVNNYGVHKIFDQSVGTYYPKWFNNSLSILLGVRFHKQRAINF